MNVAEQRWQKIQPPRWHRDGRLPAGRSFSDALIDQPLNALELHASHDGANVDGFVEWRADSQRVHAVLNLADQFIRDALLHQQARTGAANLPLVEPDAVDQAFHGAVQVGVLKNNERRLSAKFEGKLLVALRGRFANGAAHFRRTRERNLVDVGMLHQRFAGRSVSGDDVHDAGGEAGFLADVRKGERRQWRKFRGLQYDGVTGCQSGSNLPRQHEQWEIPWNDLTHNAARRVSRKFQLEQLGPARVVIKMPSYQGDIDVTALTNRLAVVQGFENRKPARMFLHLPGQCIEIARTRMRSEGLPRRQSAPRSLHRAVDVCSRSLCHRCEFFARGRISGVEIGSRRGRLPRAVYEMSEAPSVTVQPCESLARILRCRAVFHGHEFFDDAHALLLVSFFIEPGFSRLSNRMAIVRRITSCGMVFQLPLDIRQHAAGAKPE